ncbi:competence protein ComK [Lentilactobacillus sp. SPB1-3]|uniref:Competence protein ComK n=1 Tax=Lentilactobacillus terminaliae TaxID=3003483 RepID=A0ACD5DE60_9LACO|nr:competence protein ComK [Lentilactobacillus sp. SPB1-3]MCZ0977627.1 competence protein ComK [Lentilactobacillus sp. SPB1-3]
MRFSHYLSQLAKQYHENHIVDMKRIKLNHIEGKARATDIDWRNVCMLWHLGNSRYPTAILDRQQGLYAVPDKPSNLIKQLLDRRPLGCRRITTAITKHAGVKNYVPNVQGNFCISPLKSEDGKEQSWIALHQIDQYKVGNQVDTSLVQFKGCKELVSLPTTHNFIHKREQDWFAIKEFQQTILNTVKASFDAKAISNFELVQYQDITAEVRKFEQEAIAEWTAKVLKYVGFDEQTLAPKLDELMKEFEA